MVFLVVLVAYGITTQTMMYGERKPYGLIFRDIFYYGYWQLFGQLFIDEMQGERFDIQEDNPRFNWTNSSGSSDWCNDWLTNTYKGIMKWNL